MLFISREDPCEVCICVDGEIFCWWKQCPTETTTTESSVLRSRPLPTKKLRKGLKQPPKKASNYAKKKILTFPQNLPVHLSELDLINESDGTNITQTPIPRSSTTTLPSSSTAYPPIAPQNPTDVVLNATHTMSVNHAREPETTTEASTDEVKPKENVYFEKTIVNRNGVFIENIRKITEVVNRTLAPEPLTEEEDDEQGARKISLEDDALSKHYIITSSGRIENNPDSVLASESVVAQFRNNYDQLNATASPPRTSSLSSTTVDTIPMAVTTTVLAETATNAADISTTTTSTESDTTTTQTITEASTILPRLRKCIVLGQSYDVGTVLPQETGNCLQCVCIAGSKPEDSPRVTCSPHNCPPLILPDLFDTTGY